MIYYGDTAVPWGVMWSEEAEYFVAECPWFHRPAICQREAQCQGIPQFGRPHTMRQRKLHALGLCDLCAEPLEGRKKISLSQFGDRTNLTEDWQIEPMLHVECASVSLKHCPSLKRQQQEGRLHIREVFRYEPIALWAQPEDRQQYVPDYDGPPIVGLAATKLLAWRDVTQTWQ